MAKAKYFHVKHRQTGVENLVRAGKPADAIAAVAGDRSAAKLADNDEIAEFYTNGGQLHPNSAEAGAGKLFFVPDGDSRALVRAKNAGEAFGKVNGSDLYEVELTTQDQLVDLLTRGLKPITFESKKVPTASNEGAADTGAAGEPALGHAQGATGTEDGATSEGEALQPEASAGTGADDSSAAAVEGQPAADAANEESPADAAA